jgi:hypothetical protein
VGGYDLWRLSQVIDWVEPYDICNSREIFRSFMPKDAPILSTVFGTDYERIKLQLWWLLLHGDKGCIVWDDERVGALTKAGQICRRRSEVKGWLLFLGKSKQSPR